MLPFSLIVSLPFCLTFSLDFSLKSGQMKINADFTWQILTLGVFGICDLRTWKGVEVGGKYEQDWIDDWWCSIWHRQECRWQMTSRLLTLKELSKYLRISTRSVYRLIDSRSIPFTCVGGVYRFDQDAIDEWIKAGGHNGKQWLVFFPSLRCP